MSLHWCPEHDEHFRCRADPCPQPYAVDCRLVCPCGLLMQVQPARGAWSRGVTVYACPQWANPVGHASRVVFP